MRLFASETGPVTPVLPSSDNHVQRRWQVGGIHMLNINPFVATDPADALERVEERHMAENDRIVLETVHGARVICAWGALRLPAKSACRCWHTRAIPARPALITTRPFSTPRSLSPR